MHSAVNFAYDVDKAEKAEVAREALEVKGYNLVTTIQDPSFGGVQGAIFAKDNTLSCSICWYKK
jgi:hypothetical protein